MTSSNDSQRVSISVQKNKIGKLFPINSVTVQLLKSVFKLKEVKSLTDPDNKIIEPVNSRFLNLDPTKQYIINSNLSPVEFTFSLDQIPTAIKQIYTDDPQIQLEGATFLRKILSIEGSPPIEHVIKTGVVFRLVELLRKTQDTKLQFEIAWALTNIASGSSEQTKEVLKYDSLPIFVKLLDSHDLNVKEQAVWALGNIAGDSPILRDRVLESGILKPLVEVLKTTPKISVQRNAMWALSNCCRGKPQPQVSQFFPVFQILLEFLHSLDKEILVDCAWALSYLSDGPNDSIQNLIEAGIVKKVVELLDCPFFEVKVPVLRTVGNIVTGNDEQTQVVISFGALPKFHDLLKQPKINIRKEVCWAISNITAGTPDQIDCILNLNLFQVVIELLKQDTIAIKREATWAICNAISGGKKSQIEKLLSFGCIPPLCEMLKLDDPRIIHLVLEGLERCIRIMQSSNFIPETYFDIIENLQSHSNQEVASLALRILELISEDHSDEIELHSHNLPSYQDQDDEYSDDDESETDDD
ncbi:importin alpha [Anaeramoeba ignava]|uniref:Importin alpha n=1 Tax=Anaeramoeba ignava TaxID=1746090 RepID=A0A9Q0LG50_ANAIG|nr:importin alpha [Anaeramoeba ignava]